VQTYIQTKSNSRRNMKRRHCNKDTYLLTGKLFCRECESYMTGVSGNSRPMVPYHYYQCTKKRYEKNCNKVNVRREYIEQAVTSVLKEVLEDDVQLEWLADRAMEYLESERNTAELADVRSKLAEAVRKQDNLLAALEEGEMISVIKKRLKERQDEVRELQARLTVLEKENKLNSSRDRILDFLERFRMGNVEDKNYQEKMIDIFLARAYLFDDGNLKVILNFQMAQRNSQKSLKTLILKDLWEVPLLFNLDPRPSTNAAGSRNKSVSSFFVRFRTGMFEIVLSMLQPRTEETARRSRHRKKR